MADHVWQSLRHRSSRGCAISAVFEEYRAVAHKERRCLMPTPSLKLGLVGAGRIGSMHAEHLTRRIAATNLIMVADAFEEAASMCAKRYAIPFATQDYHAILDNP